LQVCNIFGMHIQLPNWESTNIWVGAPANIQNECFFLEVCIWYDVMFISNSRCRAINYAYFIGNLECLSRTLNNLA
jgi:hypothetical protein